MELPDIKREARRHIDSLEGSVVGIIQIMADDKGRVAVCIGGIPDVIINILAKSIKDNSQIKDLFEAAYRKSTEIEFDPSMN